MQRNIRRNVQFATLNTPLQISIKKTKLVKDYGVRMVCIDYLELIIAIHSEREVVLQRLKAIATDFNIAIVITSMLHRFSYAQDDLNPAFYSKQNIIHKVLIDNCDIVLVIHRPDFYIRSDKEPHSLVEEYSDVHMLQDNYLNTTFVVISFNRNKRRFSNYNSKSNSTKQRFIFAQTGIYNYLLEDLKSIREHIHWMWFIFPQLKWLERSSTSTYYGLDNIEEAREYLNDPILGARLREITKEILKFRLIIFIRYSALRAI